MGKILSQSGMSLADAYDIEGSVVEVDDLLAKEVSLVHDLSGTLFSERFSTAIIRASSGAVLQSVAWNQVLVPDITSYFRILNVTVVSDQPTRIANCNVALRDPILGRETPIWAWDTDLDPDFIVTQLDEEGGGVTATNNLLVGHTWLPAIGAGTQQPQRTPEITFRGITTAFGAGTATTIALITLAFADLQGVSSHGLPLPGW